jgi:hypothetical protein
MGIIIKDEYLIKKNITKLPNLNKFTEIKLPKYIENEEYGGKEYHSFYDYIGNYYIDENGFVSIYSKIDNSILSTLIIDDSIFIGTDHGEWSGELIFKDYDNIYPLEYNIINDNIHDIFRFQNEIFVLTGLAHLGGDKGKVHKLEYKNEKWNIAKTFNLGSEPNVYKIINNDKILIVTNKGIVIFDGNNILKNIKNGKWDYLNINSVYLNDDYIFIGARNYIFSIAIKNNYKSKIYKYNDI